MSGASDELICELDDIPDLPGAQCRGQHDVFDGAAAGGAIATRSALELCAVCPVLRRCAEWFDGLPAKQRPLGVTVGRLNIRARGRGSMRRSRRTAPSQTRPRRNAIHDKVKPMSHSSHRSNPDADKSDAWSTAHILAAGADQGDNGSTET